ncbi:transcription factor Ken 1-like [Panonychus citri]|uniref:transcription factor Ken 1-like n=1 Tax=Panonychus citri TaxID=50023 RepID=UPI002307D00C|nr:transcription factor Ken 1-like [Panonychus citri]XP_053202294.1 transcription factor Ken 1-like [Panonychus citri]
MLSSNGSDGNHSKPLRLRRVNHSDEVVIGFSKLLKTESMTDVTLICSGGQTIRAHRVILSTFSPYFRAIFESQPFSNNPCQYPVIVIKDLALSELRTIVEFIYKGEVSVSRDKLSMVLQAAKELEVSGLSDLKVDGHKCSVQMQLSDDQCSINSSGRRKSKTPRKTITSDYIGYMYQNGGGGLTDKHDNDDDTIILKSTIDDVSDYIDEDDMNGDHDDVYETNNGGGIDRDMIFQRQQQLRLQQLQQQSKYHHHHSQQSQQQKYQQQIQLQLLQEQQEAKLIELHQQLRQVSGLGSSNDTIIPDQDDSTPGLNCSDGYGDDSFPLITDLRTVNSSTGNHNNSLLTNGNGHHDNNKNASGNNNNNNSNGDGSSVTGNGKPATPDFLQPRGPGRPRKGNKSNDISPCPECNKVFVRPDVLKLHYRSVHLNERHPCNMCPKIFKWPGDLSKHKRTKHSEQMAALNAKMAAAIS